MQISKCTNLDAAVILLRFQQEHGADAQNILSEKYCVPASDLSLLCHRIFELLGTYSTDSPISSPLKLWNAFHIFAASEANVLKKQMSKNFGLSEKAFYEMCGALRQGREDLFEQVFLHHFDDCMKYLKSKYNLSHADAYDASMETLIQFRKKLIDGKIGYGNVRFLFTKMASQVYIKSMNKLKKIEGVTYNADSDVVEADLQILEKSLLDLGEECQKLLKMNFYDKMTIAKIAEVQSKNAGSLRKTKQRCLSQLKTLFAKHNY